MYKYKLTIEYEGTGFSGWQKQKHSSSIQETIEKAIFNTCLEEVDLFCAGRTDAGVHALFQVAHFNLNKLISENRLKGALNYYLKDSKIVIVKVENLGVSSDFHARFSAKSRSYIYKILVRDYPPTFNKNLVWWLSYSLNIEAMQEASKLLIGTYDLSTFRAAGCQAKSPIKTINEITISKNDDVITIYIEAPSFLYHQVRNIVGSLYYVGCNKWSVEDFKKAFLSKDRKNGGITAPASGLYFYSVKY